jgi:thiamine transport system permease protein
VDTNRVALKNFESVIPMIRYVLLKKLPLLLPVLFLAAVYFYPLSQIFLISFRPEGGWDLSGFGKLFSQAYYLHTLWFTVWQAALSTILTLILSLPLAYVFARFEFKARNLLTTLVMVPFVLPTVVVATAFDTFIGPNGWINQFLMKIWETDTPVFQITHSVFAILLAHIFYNTSVAVRIISGFWSHLPVCMEETAKMLGASPFQTFMRITFPLLRPAIFSGGLLVFLFCFSSFGVILILGGPRFATLEVEIYRQALHLFNLPMAATLSLVQIFFTLLLMGIYTQLQRRRSVALMPIAATANRRLPKSRADKLFLSTVSTMAFFLFGLPILALLFASFWHHDGLTLTYYKTLFFNKSQSLFFIPPITAMVNSVGIAVVTVILATVLGLCAAVYLANAKGFVSRVMDPVFMLPLSTSAVTLGFGFIIALDRPPLNLRTSFWIVPLAHSLVAFPFVVRSVLPALRSIPLTLKEAAQVLGADPLQVFRTVDLPIINRALLVGAVFAFTVSLGEFGATAFVARPQNATLPLAIYRFLGQPGALNYGQALAMSCILMLVTVVGFFLLERFRSSDTGEF